MPACDTNDHPGSQRQGLSRSLGLRLLLVIGLATSLRAVEPDQPSAPLGRWTNAAPAASLTPAANATPAATGSRAGTNAVARPAAPPPLSVRAYEIRGDTLLSEAALTSILVKHTGTNLAFGEIVSAATDLQMAYRARGYPTVGVALPQQQITNGIVRLQVFEGRLAEIIVANNRHFSSNNIRRALPSLETNLILNSYVFQAELDRANANRDRQIYPELRPGPETNTTSLYLQVKDRSPLHGKLELNNQNTPGTPELRVNGSLVYNNLWQLEHTLGLQYGFSPEQMKLGDQWDPYDRPLVATYGAFYRFPLCGPEAITQQMAARPGTFGYNEATRRFVLPPPSGQPELNLYASRAAIDTGLQSGPLKRLYSSASRTIDQQDVHQDLTVNQSLGLRLSVPLQQIDPLQSTNVLRHLFSASLDFKSYAISSFETNDFLFTEYLTDDVGRPLPPRVSLTSSTVPPSSKSLEYLPLAFRWDLNRQDRRGATDFGLNLSGNLWYSGSRTNLQNAVGSQRATGHWLSVGASLAREQFLYRNWKLAVRLDGQWASEPLLSNEQYGLGGVAGVRGYREGEVFGDTGWRLVIEPKSPTFYAGRIFEQYDLNLRYSAFMDYGESYLSDPQGRPGRTPLWGIGAGVFASFGSHWEARLAAGLPLLNTPGIQAASPRLYFALAAQF